MSVLPTPENVVKKPTIVKIPRGMYIYCDAEQTSFEEVGGICPNKDDPTITALTIRSIIIGLFCLFCMSFYHMWYYVTNLYAVIPPVVTILFSHIIGKTWGMISKSPWTMKEHTIVLIMSNVAWAFAVVYDVSAISFLQYEEKRKPGNFVYIFFFVISIQFLGFGFAGILRRFLVWPSSEIWPSNFAHIALLRILHQTEEVRNENGSDYKNKNLSLWERFLSNQFRFFMVIMIGQAIFFWFPRYIMPVLGGFSWICMIRPNNYILAQLTDFRGLSLGSLSLDWYTLTYFLNSPLVVPQWALVNMAVGFVLIAWVITPIFYFRNVWNTYSSYIASSTQSASNWSALGLVTTCTTLASLSAVCVHTFLHHGYDLWQELRNRSWNNKGNDMHCRLIQAYTGVPDWWFLIVSLVAITVLMITAHLMDVVKWYNVLFVLSITMIFVLPFGKVSSITGQLIQNQGVYHLIVLIASSLWAGDQPQMMSFLNTGYTTYCQTLYLVSNLKLGHYMKISPRIQFWVQILACFVCSAFSAGIQYYFFSVKRYYEQGNALRFNSLIDLTNVGSVIANNTNFFDSSTPENRHLLWSLLVGALLPIPFWFASRWYYKCHLVHIPLMLATISWMPLVDTGGMLTWILIGLVFTTLFRKTCWKRHLYLTSAAFDAGMYLSLAIIGGPLVYYNVKFPNWWGLGGSTGTGCPFSRPNAALQQSFNPPTYN